MSNIYTTLGALIGTSSPDVAHSLCMDLILAGEQPDVSNLQLQVEPRDAARLIKRAKVEVAAMVAGAIRDEDVQVEVIRQQSRKAVLEAFASSDHLTPGGAHELLRRMQWGLELETPKTTIMSKLSDKKFVEYAVIHRGPFTEAFTKRLTHLDDANWAELSRLGFEVSRWAVEPVEPGDLVALSRGATPPDVIRMGLRQLVRGRAGLEDIRRLDQAAQSGVDIATSIASETVALTGNDQDWAVIEEMIKRPALGTFFHVLALRCHHASNEEMRKVLDISPFLARYVPVNLRDLDDATLRDYVASASADEVRGHNLHLLHYVYGQHKLPKILWDCVVDASQPEELERIGRVCGIEDLLHLMVLRARQGSLHGLHRLLAGEFGALTAEFQKKVLDALFDAPDVVALSHTTIAYVLTQAPQFVEDNIERLPGWLLNECYPLVPTVAATHLLESRFAEADWPDAVRLLIEHIPGHEGTIGELIDLVEALMG